MRIAFFGLVSILTILVSAIAGDKPGGVDVQPIARFPEVKASNLAKRELSLPADFGGDHNLVLIAFQRDQQKDVDTWLSEMRRFEELSTTFRYYELPVIQRPNALMRWIIDSGMRSGIPDRKARERTITLYIDKKPFLESLLITDQKKIHAVLLDRSGNVLWRADGVFDDEKGEALKKALGGQQP